MKKKKVDNNMPSGNLTRLDDFLPPPARLVIQEETVKVTISLNKASVDFFKKEARKHNAKYQKMIRAVLDRYVSLYEAA